MDQSAPEVKAWLPAMGEADAWVEKGLIAIEDAAISARFPLPDVADLRRCVEHKIPINRCRPCWSWYRRNLGHLCHLATEKARLGALQRAAAVKKVSDYQDAAL